MPVSSLSLTWTHVYSIFLEKYVPGNLRDKRHNEFTNIEHGSLSVITYKALFNSLSRYSLKLFPIEEERIKWFVKGLNVGV